MKTRSRRTAHGTITRRRAGKGFSYRDADGQRVDAPEVLARIEALAIPPAWRNVRIAASQRARVQATGIDSAGRKQYLYHSTWRERQEARKFDRAVALARRLPGIRRAVTQDLRGKHGPKEQALAAALRIVDRLGVRVGNRRYARQHGSFGVTTIQRRHLRLDGDTISLEFPGKSGMQWSVELRDPDLAEYLRSLPKGARSRAALGYESGGGFQRIGSESLNGYLRVRAGMGVSAKDLRTWRGTVIAAESLARSGEQGLDAEEAWRRAIADAADWLHNTIAVARGSYVDPRLLLAYHEGRKLTTPGGNVSDAALAELLDSTPRTGPGT
ncbi:DNA topoisomerase IB [Sinomonas atrocyanea]|uniref:DNA topoisomerase IB n=1 Tax=Sinomonas atrocyanea TaxID=37927 RepID=UPI0027837676|nr:DNA topoisomerase IB [Sinomonas atrocyanea]MDQ0260985.1 DNA topoisomerase-1 [Sinomonas atrocyanea]MDR6622060.1 DNA topoisomerase-1 [Sinomonas atrocyanea]